MTEPRRTTISFRVGDGTDRYVTKLFERRGRGGYYPPFVDYIDASGDCWLWTGATETTGYGVTRWLGRKALPHRVIWEALVGPIPEDMQIDHLCRVRSCVNPDHLEPVTPKENTRRSVMSLYSGPRHRTHCPSGHPYSGKNVRLYRGRRYCRTCHNGGRSPHRTDIRAKE